MDLDELLNTSAPPVAARTPELTHELRVLVVKTEAARPARRRRRALVTGLAALAVVAAGWGAADAAGLTGGRVLPWTDPAGSACTLSFGVGPVSGDPTSFDYPGDPKDVPKRIDPVAQEKALSDARRFLASFDLASVDQKQAVAQYQAGQDKVAAHCGDPDPATGEDLVMASLDYLFGRELDSYLRAHGDDPALVVGGDSGGGDACFDDLPGGVGRG